MTTAVIGAGFGDEGKGRVVDFLCSNYPYSNVVRFSGGHQCGHHVFSWGNDEIKDSHVFSNFGSGTFRGAATYWSNYCTFEPHGALVELKILLSKGISPKLYVDAKCPVTTPLDIIYNSHSLAMSHGTCGVGFGATLQREGNKYSLLFEDLFNKSALKLKMNLIYKYYKSTLKCMYILPTSPMHDVGEDRYMSDSMEVFFNDVDELYKYHDNIVKTNGIPKLFKENKIIFEGSQGLLLDQNYGFFPHVTRSNTGTKNIIEYNPEIVLVTRAYQTRHGNGPMTNENLTHNIKENPYEKNKYNKNQGHFRRTLLDVNLLKYAVSKDEYISKKIEEKSAILAITCLDLIENEYRFTLNENVECCSSEEEFISRISTELGIDSIYKSSSPFGRLQYWTQ